MGRSRWRVTASKGSIRSRWRARAQLLPRRARQRGFSRRPGAQALGRHGRGHRHSRGHEALPGAPARRRALPRLSARIRRSAGHGRGVPGPLRARRAQDGFVGTESERILALGAPACLTGAACTAPRKWRGSCSPGEPAAGWASTKPWWRSTAEPVPYAWRRSCKRWPTRCSRSARGAPGSRPLLRDRSGRARCSPPAPRCLCWWPPATVGRSCCWPATWLL